jgi:hypothetical protein
MRCCVTGLRARVLQEAVAGLVAPARLVCPVAGLAAAAGATVPDAAVSAGASSAGRHSGMATAGAASAITSGALVATEGPILYCTKAVVGGVWLVRVAPAG